MLVVFDIDGTLTRTCDLDAALYAQAFRDTFGFPLPTLDWSVCRQSTDRGIAEEALRHAGRDASLDRLEIMRRRFVAALDAALPFDTERQVPGADAIVRRLQREGHAVAFATGSWEASARLKLVRSRIAVGRWPLSACDDEPDRVAILRTAIDRSGGADRHDHVVYVGDGPWDVAAARGLDIPFIGIDSDGSARLSSLGVGTILRDFSDPEIFIGAALAAGSRAGCAQALLTK